MNLENLGTSGVDPSVSGFSLKNKNKTAHVHEIGQCLQFSRVLETNEGLRDLCMEVKLCKLRFILCRHPLIVQGKAKHIGRKWGNHILHNKLEVTSVL